jgi:hypothetical protein
MKYLILILCVSISLSIISGCGDSDSSIGPGTETPPDDIVGYWKLTKIVKNGVDLTDDCTTRSDMEITKSGNFFGDDYDYDVVQDLCLLNKFGGDWVHETSNEYTLSILGNEYTTKLNGDTLTADFIHAFDGKHYMLEHLREQ